MLTTTTPSALFGSTPYVLSGVRSMCATALCVKYNAYDHAANCAAPGTRHALSGDAGLSADASNTANAIARSEYPNAVIAKP